SIRVPSFCSIIKCVPVAVGRSCFFGAGLAAGSVPGDGFTSGSLEVSVLVAVAGRGAGSVLVFFVVGRPRPPAVRTGWRVRDDLAVVDRGPGLFPGAVSSAFFGGGASAVLAGSVTGAGVGDTIAGSSMRAPTDETRRVRGLVERALEEDSVCSSFSAT